MGCCIKRKDDSEKSFDKKDKNTSQENTQNDLKKSHVIQINNQLNEEHNNLQTISLISVCDFTIRPIINEKRYILKM